MSSLIHSLHRHKQSIARDILQQASSSLLQAQAQAQGRGQQGTAGGAQSPHASAALTVSDGKAAAQMLQKSPPFFRELVLLAEMQVIIMCICSCVLT